MSVGKGSPLNQHSFTSKILIGELAFKIARELTSL